VIGAASRTSITSRDRTHGRMPRSPLTLLEVRWTPRPSPALCNNSTTVAWRLRGARVCGCSSKLEHLLASASSTLPWQVREWGPRRGPAGRGASGTLGNAAWAGAKAGTGAAATAAGRASRPRSRREHGRTGRCARRFGGFGSATKLGGDPDPPVI
jgi:hypothetical protein